MAAAITGGATSAVAASTHAACARFRGTDPLITGQTRRGLARLIGRADVHGGIPDARWMRAMTFERLVRDERFASEVATTTVGRLNLRRPTGVAIVDAGVNVDRTAELLREAHQRALADGVATMIHGLAIPFVGFETERATDVKPDFAVVAAQTPQGTGSSDFPDSPEPETPTRSWLIVGDAKDYERVRSRVDDKRLLKGFLQVALGAESAAHWSQLPTDQQVHDFGVLAVPRNAFLQPEALVDDLHDHRAEVRMRVQERRDTAAATELTAGSLTDHVQHLQASFDPATCTTCTLFSYCRDELRNSTDRSDLLVELGVPIAERAQLSGLLDGVDEAPNASADTRSRVIATITGVAQSTRQRRTDPIGEPGTLNVVIAKSDSAALGVYGLSLQSHPVAGPNRWLTRVFDDPQSALTRRTVVGLIGAELQALIAEQNQLSPEPPNPVHLVVPDRSTADLLASMADNLAGVELSRLRWEHDLAQGREPLTFNGEPATVPEPLTRTQRLGVSFLLEEDRARAFALRSPIVDARAVLARHVVAGGPAVSAYRLDYLLAWAQSSAAAQLDHRALGDAIEEQERTPGARLTNDRSNAIHRALSQARRTGTGLADYDAVVRDELRYKAGLLDQTIDFLGTLPVSALRPAYRAIEGDAQRVWQRRNRLHASDLVRFGRTYRYWRNALVPMIQDDATCLTQLQVLGNPHQASIAARDAGNRRVAGARVIGLDPLVLEIDSRHLGDGSRVVLLHVNDQACVERPGLTLTVQLGAVKLGGLAAGPLTISETSDRHFVWAPENHPELQVGDELVVADFTWFCDLKGSKFLNVKRPRVDSLASPHAQCTAESFAADPESHQWCCRPHEIAEAQWSDTLAERRARGELNPEVWPPVVDTDAFEVSPNGAPSEQSTAAPTATTEPSAPDDLTLDDLE